MAGSSAPPSDSNPLAAGSSGASKYLANLPSRGLFSSTVLSSNPDYSKLPPYRMDRTCYCYWAAKHHHAVEKLNHLDYAKVDNYGCRLLNHCWVSYNYVQVYGVGPGTPLSYTGTGSIADATTPQGGMRVYICDHDTAPPDDQLIKTNQTNILIRSLTLKKQKGDSSSKDIKSASPSEASRKRPAERVLDGRASAKRGVTNNQAVSRQEGSRSRVPEKDFQSLTVERLRALLKEKGLSVKGKKDELIARLRGANSQS